MKAKTLTKIILSVALPVMTAGCKEREYKNVVLDAVNTGFGRDNKVLLLRDLETGTERYYIYSDPYDWVEIWPGDTVVLSVHKADLQNYRDKRIVSFGAGVHLTVNYDSTWARRNREDFQKEQEKFQEFTQRFERMKEKGE